MHVHHARDRRRLGLEPAGQREVLGGVLARAADLHVDGRGEPEVEHLGDDVGRCEEKHQIGKALRQRLAQSPQISGRGAVIFPERHEDFAVRGRHHGAIADGEVDAAARDAHVVDDHGDFGGRDHLADGVLHLRETLLGFLDARAGAAAHMQAQLPSVHCRKGVLADVAPQAARAAHQQDEAAD